MHKKITFFIVVCFLSLQTSFTQVLSGSGGEHITWRFYEAADSLNIYGTGEMYDFVGVFSPWHELPIRTVVIHNGVTSIGASAFSQQFSLESVTIGRDVRRIGEGAFFNCISLQSVTIPGSANVESWAFHGSLGLTEVIFTNDETSSEVYTYIGQSAFVTGRNSITRIILSENLRYIGYSAFQSSAITEIVFPENLRHIGHFAFRWSTIEEIIIPDNVETIGMGAFASNDSLHTVTIGRNVKLIEMSAFTGANLRTLNYNAENAEIRGGNVPFHSTIWRTITTLNIGDNVRVIPDDAFPHTNLSEVIIPEGVTSIGDRAFRQTSITSVYIPGSVTSIGFRAFHESRDLTSVTISEGVRHIGWEAFRHTDITSINIPSSVTTIDFGAFITNLTEVRVNWTTPLPIGNVFGFANTSNVRLLVPAGTRAAYQAADVWRNFSIVEKIKEESITIIPQRNSVTKEFQAIDGAEYYILIIYSDAEQTEKFASYRIDAFGNAVPITRNGNTGTMISHTITGLEAETQYFFSLTAHDNNDQMLSILPSGSFTTLGDDVSINAPEINLNRTPVAFYTITGARLGQKPQSGIFIILYCDGTAERVMR